MLGPAGAGIGAQLGDWGATILGMGDYEVKENSIMNGSGVPTMHKTDKSVRISHKEFLGDITGSTGFQNRVFTIQPGSSTTFPWLSNIACMFQSYKFRGLCFEFVSMSADALNSVNTALGTVIMATQYNSAMPDFLNKAEMEQYEFTCTTRPSRSLIHAVECDPNLQVMDHLYTRTGALPNGQDVQFYDWGKFQLATVGMQAAATIGELWVTYDVEFFKPRIASGGAWPGDFTYISNGPYTQAADVLGSIQTNPVGNLGVTITAGANGWQRIQFPANISAGRFQVIVTWRGNTTGTFNIPGITLSNLTLVNQYRLGTTGQVAAPSGGSTTQTVTIVAQYTVNGYNANGSYIEYSNGGNLPLDPTNVDINVIAVPVSNASF